jgi:hypothetical protein
MATTTDTLIQPGFLKIEKAEIYSPGSQIRLDVQKLIVEIDICDALNEPFTTCNVMLNDGFSLFTLLPLTGDETFTITASIPHPAYPTKLDKVFRVISIQDMTNTNQVRNAAFVMRCILPEAFKNWTTRIRKSYSEITIADMVKKVAKDFLNIDVTTQPLANTTPTSGIRISPTEGTRTIVIPNMYPARALRFLAREAKAAPVKDAAGNSMTDSFPPSNFVFFGGIGGYFFKTIEELLTQLPDDKYFVTEKNFFPGGLLACTNPGLLGTNSASDLLNQVGNNPFVGQKPYEFMKINSWRVLSMFSLEGNLQRGAFDNTVFSLDPSLSLFDKKTYNYNKDYATFKRTDRTGGKVVYEQSDLTKLTGASHQRMIFTNKDSGDQKPEFLHLLAASAGMIDFVTIEITVPGDVTRRVGDIVRIGLPEFSAFDNTISKENLFLAGDWLVTAVKHIYNPKAPNGYQLVMECVKNSFKNKPEDSAKLREGGAASGTAQQAPPTTPTVTSGTNQ